jgi:PTS system nitrogen regulatory IIA component
VTRLASILDPSCILLDVGGGTRRDVLARIAAAVAGCRSDLDEEALLDELLRREEASSTAIADGIAIPHARPEQGTVATACLARSPKGVDFDSLDGKPTQLLLTLVSPAADSTLHVRWLAHVARILGDAPTRARLLAATSEAEVLRILEEREHTAGIDS